jgi:hypothetical protein
MPLTSIYSQTRKNIRNLPGWRNNRRIVVIESDDWGSIRMPSRKAFDKLEKSGLDLRSEDAERYNLNDTLADSNDLAGLFETLSGFKDHQGNHPVFTAVSIMANPDFNKIRASGFNSYYYEPFTESLKRYPGCENSFELWKEGISKKLFVPQFHGREHLNVTAWMKALKNGDSQTRLAFDEGVWGFVPPRPALEKVDYQAAFLLADPGELDDQKRIIHEGLELFYKVFGYRTEYFVAPNGPVNNVLNFTLVQNGIAFRYGSTVQIEPLGFGKSRKVLHWLGQKDESGLRYITRNCFFEPSQPGKDWIDCCLDDIRAAFRWSKPAIISSHRVNYIGSLYPENRDKGLTQLRILLKSMLAAWPDVEFMTTPALGKLIERSTGT